MKTSLSEALAMMECEGAEDVEGNKDGVEGNGVGGELGGEVGMECG